MVFGITKGHVGDFHMNTLAIVFIVLICVVFVAIIGTLLCLQYKRLVKMKIIFLTNKFEILQKLPIKTKLRRIEELAKYNNQYQSKLPHYRAYYQQLYGEQLFTIMTEFQELLERPKNQWWILNNLAQRTKKVEMQIRDLLLVMNKDLATETLQREYILHHKQIFNELLEDNRKLEFNVKFNTQRLNNFIASIEAMFSNFETNLNRGDFKTTNEIIYNITTALIVFVEILDYLPRIAVLALKVIPHKLDMIAQKNIETFTKYHRAVLTSDEYGLFQKNVEQQVTKIMEMSRNLQYKKADKAINQTLMLVQRNEMSVQTFANEINNFHRYLKFTLDTSNELERTLKILRETLDVPRLGGLMTDRELNIYNQLLVIDKRIAHDSAKLLLTSQQSGGEMNYHEPMLLIQQILEQCLQAQKLIVQAEKILGRISEEQTLFYAKIHFVEVVLLQAEVRLNQLRYQKLRQLFQKQIATLRQKVAGLKTIEISTQDRKRTAAALQQVIMVEGETIALFEEIKNTILVDVLSQETMIYLNRYLLLRDDLDEAVHELEFEYRDGNKWHTLQKTTALLKKIKTNT